MNKYSMTMGKIHKTFKLTEKTIFKVIVVNNFNNLYFQLSFSYNR